MKMKSTSLVRTAWLVFALTLFQVAPSLLADYVQTNLVSNSNATPAVNHDSHLVNPWGLVSNGGSPFWASDQATGLSTLYDGAGNILPLVVSIPGSGPPAGPTGIVANTAGFNVDGTPAAFIFATLSGTIAGWNGTPTLNQAVTEATIPGAVFTGLTEATNASNTFLYAADFKNGTINVFNSSYAQVSFGPGSFTDPNLPPGYSPYNIQVVNGKLYVEYAPVGPHGLPLVGDGNGIVDVFKTNGVFAQRLITGGQLNVPWGIAQAPAGFGQFGGDLLVGNFGNGWINAFDPSTGTFIGTLEVGGKPFEEQALWALDFGIGSSGGTPGVLYFTSGLTLAQTGGLFGSISTTPEPAALTLLGSGLIGLLGLARRKR